MQTQHDIDIMTAQIIRNAVAYNCRQVRFYCILARQTPSLRSTMLNRARALAAEIKEDLRSWRTSDARRRLAA